MRFWLSAVLVGLVGCGGSGEEELGPHCSAVSDACHDAEEAGVAGAAECHDIAHEADEDACAAAHAECEATCAGGDTGLVE